MPPDEQVWQALLRAKGLTISGLADAVQMTRQHVQRLVTGKRSADANRADLDRALALGPRRNDADPDGELPVDVILEELRNGFAETLRLRAAADDPRRLGEVDALLERAG